MAGEKSGEVDHEVVLSIERDEFGGDRGVPFTGFAIRTSKRTYAFYADEEYYGAEVFYSGPPGPEGESLDEVSMLGERVLSGLGLSRHVGCYASADGGIFDLGNLRTASMTTTAGTITIGCWKRSRPRELLLKNGRHEEFV